MAVSSRFTGPGASARLALLLVLLTSAVLTACATRARPRVLPPESRRSASPGSATPAEAEAVAAGAVALIGTPYRAGGADPSGFDCSGLVQYVFAKAGIALPRDVTAQYREGRPVDPDDIRPGDLLFFDTGGGRPSHVVIAIGNGEFVHAPAAGGEVRAERMTAYWSKRFMKARRVLAS